MQKHRQQKPKFAYEIERFCDMMTGTQRDYEWHRDQVNKMDKLTQDYIHKLELEGLNYKQRAKIATQLAAVRQKRRENKDTAEVLQPLVEFLDSEKGKQMLNLVREALGKTRKLEERMENRVYVPRVLDEDYIRSK